jgi:predicted enzyme related to lactoylglutathione lyase
MAGKPVHIEIGAKDSQRALQFYGKLFGWEFQNRSPDASMEYHMARFGEDSGGAIYPIGDEPTILVYFDTDDIQAATARVRELGGSSEEVMPIPTIGYSCHCTDTEGNRFGLFQFDESVTPPGA